MLAGADMAGHHDPPDAPELAGIRHDRTAAPLAALEESGCGRARLARRMAGLRGVDVVRRSSRQRDGAAGP